MKRFLLTAIVSVSLLAPAAAFADTTVNTPKIPATQAEVASYIDKLDSAVKRECRRVVGPLIGVAVYAYQSCLAETRVEVAKRDPTGLYAKSESVAGLVLAAR